MPPDHREPPGVCTGCGGNCQPRRPLCSYCREARRVAALEQEAQPAPAPVSVSSYACRPHFAPVTWKGTGCPECTADMARKPKRKPKPAPKAEFEELQ